MSIITISRQYGSGGDEIAQTICDMLGYQMFDKRMIVQAAADTGLSEAEIVDFSEESHRIKSFFDRLFAPGTVLSSGHVWYEDTSGMRVSDSLPLSEEVMLELEQKAILSAHKSTNAVILGRGGQMVLKDAPGVVHVRIEAPLEDRIQRVKDEVRVSRQLSNADIELRRAAQDRINERDAVSADYLRRFYHVDWADPTLYHIIINTGRVSFAQAAAIIYLMVQELEGVK